MKWLTAIPAPRLEAVRAACREYEKALANFSDEVIPTGNTLRALVEECGESSLRVSDEDWRAIETMLGAQGMEEAFGLLLWPPATAARVAFLLVPAGANGAVKAWLRWQALAERTIILLAA